MSDLVERLRGIYRVPINDGLGKVEGNLEPENEREFVRQFQSPPIQIEAADEIERLRAGIKRLSDEEELCAETTGDDPFSLVYLAAKLARVEHDLASAEGRAKNATSDLHYWRGQYDELAATDSPKAQMRGTDDSKPASNYNLDNDLIAKSQMVGASDEVKAFLEGVVGVVEANSFEAMCLWQAHHESRKWVSNSSGYLPCVGHIDGRPVHLSLLTATIDGHKILFIDPTSQAVDWKLIDAWLEANLPKSAFRESAPGTINKTDAMNFGNVFPARAALSAREGSDHA